MPKTGYTSITVPNDLYSTLKNDANKLKISIGDYILKLSRRGDLNPRSADYESAALPG